MNIKIDTKDLMRAQLMFANVRSATPQVAMRAINKTLTGMRTDAVREIREDVTPKAKTIRKAISLDRPRKTTMTGYFIIRGSPLSLMHYKARQTKKGVTVHVKKKNPRKLLPHAFIAGGRGGAGKHVFQRYYVNPNKYPVKPFRPGFAYGALPKEYRLPVERLTGPSIPAIMAREPVMQAIEQKAHIRLKKNFEHEMSWKLSKLAGK